MNQLARRILSGAAVIGGLVFGVEGALAQQIDQPWSFSPQNRAQLAVTMKQLKDGGGGGVGSSGSGSLTTIVCGGGSATATANNTCIILNNATGEIETGQNSDGSQEASNSTDTTVNGASDADAVLEALQGN